jgi:hypothetical protein
MLKECSRNIYTSLYDFTIFINHEKIECNKAFCCCLSEVIFQAVLFDETLSEFHFNNIQNEEILISLFNILDGKLLQGDIYQDRSVTETFYLIDCNFEYHFDFENYKDIV